MLRVLHSEINSNSSKSKNIHKITEAFTEKTAETNQHQQPQQKQQKKNNNNNNSNNNNNHNNNYNNNNNNTSKQTNDVATRQESDRNKQTDKGTNKKNNQLQPPIQSAALPGHSPCASLHHWSPTSYQLLLLSAMQVSHVTHVDMRLKPLQQDHATIYIYIERDR